MSEQGLGKPKGDERISMEIPSSQQDARCVEPSFPHPNGHLGSSNLRRQKVAEQACVKYEKVMERVYERRRLREAWQQVRRNAGAAGIDKMTVKEFERNEQGYLDFIHEKLKAGHWRFKPARRVLIPKPGSSKEKRKLGIPVVMDRVVAQSVNLVFEEIFSGDFTPSNYGFRRGKSQHQAIDHMRHIVLEGYEQCVSIDLKSFFDEIPHELILKLIRRKIRDEKLITLIARALKAGVIVDGKFEKTQKGCPQGSPLSPMISNIVLNEMDQELEKRRHRYVRWADDFLVFVKSPRAAERVMKGMMRYLEENLGLEVNGEKSQVAPVHKITFLGFQILRGKINVSRKARAKLKQKVRELTKRNNPLSMIEITQQLNQYLRGWVEYFRIQEFEKILEKLDYFIRYRLRSMQLKKWKKPKKFQRVMIRAGIKPSEARRIWVRMNRWRSIRHRMINVVLNLSWFRKLGVIFLDDFTQRTLQMEFPFDTNRRAAYLVGTSGSVGRG